MPEQVEVDYPLKEIHDRKTDSRAQANKAAQTAKTLFRKISSCEINEAVDRYSTSRYSLIESIPLTGRKHQIRRHLKHLSHPIIGDVNYGSGVHNQFFRTHFDSHRLLLACTSLAFTHPISKQKIEVQAPLEANFAILIDKLGLQK